jgi:hypothetical protein
MRRLCPVIAGRGGTYRHPSPMRQQRVMAEMLDALAIHLDLALLVEAAQIDPFEQRPAGRLPAHGARTPSC